MVSSVHATLSTLTQKLKYTLSRVESGITIISWAQIIRTESCISDTFRLCYFTWINRSIARSRYAIMLIICFGGFRLDGEVD